MNFDGKGWLLLLSVWLKRSDMRDSCLKEKNKRGGKVCVWFGINLVGLMIIQEDCWPWE